jgi:hypothetical protein
MPSVALPSFSFKLPSFAFKLPSFSFISQMITYWNRGVDSSEQLSINSWNTLKFFSINSWHTISHDVRGLPMPSLAFLKLPNISLPSFNFRLPTFSFKMPSVSFKMPSLSFKVPPLKLPSFSLAGIFGTNKAPAKTAISMPENTGVQTKNVKVANPVKEAAVSMPQAVGVKDCGSGLAPKLGAPLTYENNSVLSCLGEGAISCENTQGTLKDDFFPTIFQITNEGGACKFKLSYGADSKLVDITGHKLAGQSISCPIDIVRTIEDTSSATPRFILPDKTDSSKYASQIYSYGTLGLFIQNNLDGNKIRALGCDGAYIGSVIASYAARTK